MTHLIDKAEQTAKKLHEGKAFGKDSNMYEQLKGGVKALLQFTTLTGEELEVAAAGAWLEKSQEKSKLGEGRAALTDDDLLREFGFNVTHLVHELNAEPEEDKTKRSDEIWYDKIEKWSMKTTAAAREILMAEKRHNFITSRTAPNPKKPPEWHLDYYLTRMLQVEAHRSVNEKLYQELRTLAVQGISYQVEQIALNQEIEAAKAAGQTGEGITQAAPKTVQKVYTNLISEKVAGEHMRLNEQRTQAILPAEVIAGRKSWIHERYGMIKEASRVYEKQFMKSDINKTAGKTVTYSDRVDMTRENVFTYVFNKGIEHR